MSLTFAPEIDDAIPLYAIAKGQLALAPETAQNWAAEVGFKGDLGSVCLVPDETGKVFCALAGLGEPGAARQPRFAFAAARGKLPVGTYRLKGGIANADLDEAALGWLLAGYRFDIYRNATASLPELIAPEGIDAPRLEVIAAAEKLTRDLINTPTNDMGPSDLESACRALATEQGAEIDVITGDELLEQGFPLIHTVGRASTEAPRLIKMRWGTSGPKLTLVGKGVCFDTGGLNIKPGASMGLMKKDMGGAANVIGLAKMIMGLELKVQLTVLIPAVENAIAGDAFRPGDILTSRKGLTVEVNNTDAEGRLVLADALALADEDTPDLILSMATLTGAARVAVGPDLAPFYATLDTDAVEVGKAATRVADPVWRMPFWDAYETMIEPGIADLDNAPKGGFAGSITAALFLRRFVTDCPRYMHFDIFGWNPAAAPGRPKGGAAQGPRALLEALPNLLKL